jgi:hypothetical protein
MEIVHSRGVCAKKLEYLLPDDPVLLLFLDHQPASSSSPYLSPRIDRQRGTVPIIE